MLNFARSIAATHLLLLTGQGLNGQIDACRIGKGVLAVRERVHFPASCVCASHFIHHRTQQVLPCSKPSIGQGPNMLRIERIGKQLVHQKLG